jgi:alpha-1,2-mannosyltransferase
MKKGVVLVGVMVIEVVMGIVLILSTDHGRIETTDFLNFYAAATIVRQGHGHDLYQPETQEQALEAILGRRVAEFYLHPPFEAAALSPLSYLRIEQAFVIWTLVNLGLLGLLPLIFAECIPFIADRPYLALLSFVFPPVLAALTLGQDSIMVLFSVSLAYMLWVKKRDFEGGLVLALATVKFQYVLILVLFLLLSRKFRLTAGFALGCAFLAVTSVLVTGFSGLIEYFRFVHQFDLHNGYGNISSDRMMNLRGLLAGLGWTDHWRLLFYISSVILVVLTIVCARSIRTARNQPLGFSLCVATALAASPYNYFQDASLLLLPVFLVLDSVVSRSFAGPRARLMIACCVLLFLWPVILLAFGGHYFWNSHIYLVFPVILLFIATLMVELYPRKNLKS